MDCDNCQLYVKQHTVGLLFKFEDEQIFVLFRVTRHFIAMY